MVAPYNRLKTMEMNEMEKENEKVVDDMMLHPMYDDDESWKLAFYHDPEGYIRRERMLKEMNEMKIMEYKYPNDCPNLNAFMIYADGSHMNEMDCSCDSCEEVLAGMEVVA
tara:strand:+ start:1419 stop:1751 length:333 start_codon:yes stop_codon:yes gene_type:complete